MPASYQGASPAGQPAVLQIHGTGVPLTAERMTFAAPVQQLRMDGDPRLVLVADHASNALPASYGTLGLPEASFLRHIAYDLGVRTLVEELSASLDAPAVLAGFSRLLIDPNRGEDDPTLVMRLSDGEIIPGNARVDDGEIAERIARYHRPYHLAIDAAFDAAAARGVRPYLISIHSFTPSWRGRVRPWQCAILWNKDAETAGFLFAALRAEGLAVGDNQPYSGTLENDCMDRHGTKRGVSHALIEIRQDLLRSPEGQKEWRERLARILGALRERRSG